MTDRYESTKRAGLYGIICNIFLLLIKATIGFISKSQAMISDSINSAGDIFASLMTFIGNKISSTPHDDDHNFGHGKAEYIFSMFIALSMILVACKALYDSFITLIYGSELTFSWVLVVVCIITIITKLCLYIYTKKIATQYDNLLLISNMKDHRNDCVVTTFTLISVLLTLADIYWVDSIVGMGISAWICYTGITIFIESYNVLMDVSIDNDTKDNIMHCVKKFDKIEEVKELISSPVGYKYIVFLTICVDGDMSTRESHQLADNIENEVCKIEKVYKTIVHVEPK